MTRIGENRTNKRPRTESSQKQREARFLSLPRPEPCCSSNPCTKRQCAAHATIANLKERLSSLTTENRSLRARLEVAQSHERSQQHLILSHYTRLVSLETALSQAQKKAMDVQQLLDRKLNAGREEVRRSLLEIIVLTAVSCRFSASGDPSCPKKLRWD